MRYFPRCLLLRLICLFALGLSVSVSAKMARAQADSPSPGRTHPGSGVAADARETSAGTRVPVQSVGNPQDSSTLVIGSGDEVEVTVYGAPDLSRHTRVGSDGNISLPLVGQIRVVGLTSDQAQQAISDQLRKQNIVNDPQVSVFVKDYTNGEISVAGEVSKPGVFS